MSFYIYIIFSAKCDKYYVGHTESLLKRVWEHNNGKGGKFSRTCAPWVLVYLEEFDSRLAAIKREKEIKAKKSKRYIVWLIEGDNS